MNDKRFVLLPLLLLFLLVLVPGAVAQTTVTDDEVNDVARGLFCPVCESTPLDVCPTQACADWRELIREKLADGESKQEIQEYFARQYGDGVLATPPRRGFNLILWAFPVVAVLAGGVLFGRYVSQLRAGDEPEASPAPEEPPTAENGPPASAQSLDDYIARVEEELKSA